MSQRFDDVPLSSFFWGVKQIIADTKHFVWANVWGLAKYDYKDWILYDGINSDLKSSPNCFTVDQNGIPWLAWGDKISRFEEIVCIDFLFPESISTSLPVKANCFP